MENLKNIQPVEDFNWDAFEQGETYTEVSKDDLVKTYDETLNTVKDKEVVMGTVTSMNKREVVVNIGFKSDGVIPRGEFSRDTTVVPSQVVQPGDEIEVFVVRVNDGDGNVLLSRKRIEEQKGMEDIEKAFNEKTVVTGTVTVSYTHLTLPTILRV